ncbi:hypothetical protein ACOME3_006353 [Neoechinorhynchus agilis]
MISTSSHAIDNLINSQKQQGSWTCIDAPVGKNNVYISIDHHNVLEYRLPPFRARSTVLVPPLKDKETCSIGWVQACSKMNIFNKYGNYGLTSWILPDLLNKRYEMISDSDGKCFPWYGTADELRVLKGPTTYSTVCKVTMEDSLSSKVSLSPPHHHERVSARLTEIHREQNFVTWLVKMEESPNRKKVTILRAIKWGVNLKIHQNAQQCYVVEEYSCVGPEFLDGENLLPKNCFTGPTANFSQLLIWISGDGNQRCAIKGNFATL